MKQRIKNLQQAKSLKSRYTSCAILMSCLLLSGVTVAKMSESKKDGLDYIPAPPVKRVEPMYPAMAAKKNIEGEVVLQFDISKTGTTENIKVIKSTPEGVFDKSAITALKQWKYKPRIQGGIPEKQVGLKVALSYELDSKNKDKLAKNGLKEATKMAQK